MKKLCHLLIIFCLFSCINNNNKSIYDMEEESLATGIRVDTFITDIWFGMSEPELYKSLGIYKGETYQFDIESLYKYKFNVNPNYYNDSLYMLGFIVYSFPTNYVSLDFESVMNTYSMKYGKSDTLIVKNSDNKSAYWFIGNLSLSVNIVKDNNISFLSISYEDLSKNIIERDLIHKPEAFFDVWTPDYYNNVYLPRAKQKLDGI